jgi:preprotein translocase subunit YajC
VNALPLIILAVLLLGMLFFAQRNRQKAAAAEQQRRQSIGVGTDVMTTSGLYGTVTAVNDDDTVLLSVAPGVEVRFAFAALRDVASIPVQYRSGLNAAEPDEPSPADQVSPSTPAPPPAEIVEKPAPERPDA